MRPAMSARSRAAGLVLLVLAAACGGNSYPPDVVQNFVDSCKVRSDERTCRCAITAIQRRYTLEQFNDYEAEMRAGRVPAEMMEVVSDCQR
jgi:hypothetical protein